jgi:hypothetical protein
MAFKCGHCGFNFEELDLIVRMETLLNEKGIDGDRLRLYCPACGTENWLELKPFGILQSQNELFQWRSATTRLKKPGAPVTIGGSFALEIPDRVKILSEKEICYPKIAVFRQLNLADSIPRWPVRPEYLKFIDTEKDYKPEIIHDEYHIQLPVKGLSEPLEVRLPLVPVRQDRPALGENAAFKGVHVVMWPKAHYKVWNRHFLRFGWSGEMDESPWNQSRQPRVYAYGKAALDSTKKEWIAVDAVASDGQTLFGCVDSRPEWIAIEFKNTDRDEVIGGGIWSVAAVAEDYPDISDTIISIDFGTSNTCVAVGGGGGDARFIPVDSCDDYLILGSKLPDTVTFADTWPPRQGFGKSKAVFPTEILSRQELDQVRLQASKIKGWRPVVDYGIPTGGAKVVFDEEKHILSDFKWDEMIRDGVLRELAPELQKRYIEFILLYALAQLANERRSIGKTISTKFSYPLAFEKPQRERFVEVIKAVTESVGKMTGLNLNLVLEKDDSLVDEARAAASSISPAGKKAFLYVDVGGGSSDIALEITRIGEKKQQYSEYAYIASIRYAGGALVEALDGGHCLLTSVSGFRRLIREVGQVRDLTKRGNVFDPHRSGSTNAKTSYFYGYLMEFLARLLAAHVITDEYRKGMTQDEIAYVKEHKYSIALFALGNGWGFGHLFDPEYAKANFAPDLTKRTNEILEEAKEKKGLESVPQVEVEVPDGFGISDPKAAVVFGLLKGGNQVGERKEVEWDFRTIVGCTTTFGSTRSVPWYLPVSNLSNRLPENNEELPLAMPDCPKEEWPEFNSKLMTPHEIDPGLNQIRSELTRCIQSGHRWFVQSPLHVLMEKLIKPNLKRQS